MKVLALVCAMLLLASSAWSQDSSEPAKSAEDLAPHIDLSNSGAVHWIVRLC